MKSQIRLLDIIHSLKSKSKNKHFKTFRVPIGLFQKTTTSVSFCQTARSLWFLMFFVSFFFSKLAFLSFTLQQGFLNLNFF